MFGVFAGASTANAQALNRDAQHAPGVAARLAIDERSAKQAHLAQAPGPTQVWLRSAPPATALPPDRRMHFRGAIASPLLPEPLTFSAFHS